MDCGGARAPEAPPTGRVSGSRRRRAACSSVTRRTQTDLGWSSAPRHGERSSPPYGLANSMVAIRSDVWGDVWGRPQGGDHHERGLRRSLALGLDAPSRAYPASEPSALPTPIAVSSRP